MRLSHIHLAGFKSFVDPTTVAFPSNRVGVVGPNGCGKSNVIDAIRWVMGESSAKTLRGGSMADVIFNGSRSRPRAKAAEVELVFAEANLIQYPDMKDIAIKRRVERDGQSQYFLNGVRCRRKDITNIFLGTGLGPRSYAIIEQGMISRFIEAKPDELRGFIEEAAGVSKYKERRRETELRIGHTMDNMNRLSDIREELDKQLERLKRQARAAERYRKLKEAEKQLRGQLLAMRWQHFSSEVTVQEAVINEQDLLLKAQHEQLEANNQQQIEQRVQQNAATERFNEVQEKYYAQQSVLERLKQSIEHSQEKETQLRTDFERTNTSLQEAQATLTGDNEQLERFLTDMETLGQEEIDAQQEVELSQELLDDAEIELQTWQMNWEDSQQQLNELSRQREVAQTQAQNLQNQLTRNHERLEKLAAENRELDLENLETQIHELEMQLQVAEETVATWQNKIDDLQATIGTQRDENQQLADNLHEQRDQLQQLNGRLSSLEALQESALGKDNKDMMTWLEERQIDVNAPRLAQIMQVEPGWERAVETVLGAYLEALCIDSLDDLLEQLDSLPQGRMTMIAHTGEPAAPGENTGLVGLLDKVQGDNPATGLLAGIFVADTLVEAYGMRPQLAAHESIITAQGLWLGPNWLSINEEVDQRAGVFAREQDINDLRETIETLETGIASTAENLSNGQIVLKDAETQRDEASHQLRAAQQALTQFKAEQGGQQARLEQMSARAKQLLAEHTELKAQTEQEDTELQDTQTRLVTLETELTQRQAGGEELSRQRETRQEAVLQLRQRNEAAKGRKHQLDARLQSLQTDIARLQQSVERLTSQINQLTTRRDELEEALTAIQPVENWHEQHDSQLAEQQQIEEQLTQARDAVRHGEERLRTLEQEHRELEANLNLSRTRLEEARLSNQTSLARRQSVEEQLQEGEYNVEFLLENLPAEANEAAWQEGIEEIEQKTQRLGSINMAALEELEEHEERKNYLDQQHADLEEALRALEQAIASIDEETRNRFMETLNRVDEGFQRMFPKLFGGGQAFLKLTSEDVLSAGVAVMARPPGKRNSSIHLLSGGEKALTAVALVFSIFELNPAPFCMLDEVDAPLDDANVSRYCNLVKAMSEHVQFIFISHNKIAIEMADQLIGVTMQEPGVSRPVTVDLDIAVAMAEDPGTATKAVKEKLAN